MDYRLGDVIDDYCIKCRRLTNHSVVSLLQDEVAKVRCRSCYHEHSYLKEQAPPSRKDLKKAELAAAAAKAEAEGQANPESAAAVAAEAVDGEPVNAEGPAEASPVGRGKARKA